MTDAKVGAKGFLKAQGKDFLVGAEDAFSKIEALSLDAQTQIITHGLESEAAKNFLETMPKVEALMPSIQVTEIQSLVEAKRAERKRLEWMN